MKRILSIILVLAVIFLPTSILAQEASDINSMLIAAAETKLAEDVNTLADQKGEQEYLITFCSDPNADTVLSEEAQQDLISRQDAEVRYVRHLEVEAQKVQQPFIQYLKNRDIEFKSFYIANMMWVKADYETMMQMAQNPKVEHVYLNKKVHLSPQRTTPAADGGANESIEWNIKQIEADVVWREGVKGQGVTVGIIDSGGDWKHPAIKNKWKAYDPANPDSPKADELAYSWFDPVDHTELPVDYNDHGTHCLGTILGRESDGTNTIGVAPEAQWIAAKAFGADGSADGKYILECAEWMLAPGGDVTKRPQVINNSWGSSDGVDDWFRGVVKSWRKAGIVPVFAAGNKGLFEPDPWPGSIEIPSNYPESFAVAATDKDNKRASFSKLGPSPYDARLIKPEISAPGVSIRSSVVGGDYREMDGTSMATPHITGVVALMLSANRNLTVDESLEAMTNTATPLIDGTYPDSPNMGYGYGLVNAKKAVDYVSQGLSMVKGSVLVAGEDVAEPELTDVIPGPALTYMDRDYFVTATARDDVSNRKVELLYKWPEDSDYYILDMRLKEGHETDGKYVGHIPKAPFFGAAAPDEQSLKEGRMTYKVRLTDYIGNVVESDEYTCDVLFGAERGAWHEDMQSDMYGWAFTGDWNQGIPSAYGEPKPFVGEKLVGTSVGQSSYEEGQSYLITPPLDLRDTTVQEATFKYRHWFNMSTASTVGRVMVTDNDGRDWYELREDFYTGEGERWSPDSVSLADYVGTQDPVYVAFVLSSSYSYGPGWYINEVELEGKDITPPAPPTDLVTQKNIEGNRLSWEPSVDGDVKLYEIYRQAEDDTEFTKIGESSLLYYLDQTVEGGSTYSYKVRAIDHAGNIGEYSDVIEVTTLNYTVLSFDDFEDSDGDYTVEIIPSDDSEIESVNSWEWGEVEYGPKKAWSGTKLWGTNLTGDYKDNSNSRIVTPSLAVPDSDAAIVLNFRHWYDGEKYWGSVNAADDYGQLEISTDDGQTFTPIPKAKWAGHIMEWQSAMFDLSAYKGQNIRIAFRFVSDKWSFGSETFMGWYIDDVGLYEVHDTDFEIPEIAVLTPAVCDLAPETCAPEHVAALSIMTYASDKMTAEEPVKQGLIPVDEAWVKVEETGYSAMVNRADGMYQMRHPYTTEEHTLTAGAYGYYPESRKTHFNKDTELIEDFVLTKIPRTSISGQVIDRISGEPISGVTVRLLEDGRIAPVITDDKGMFRLAEIFAGDYTLHIYHTDYQITTMPVTALMDEDNQVEASLLPFVPYENELYYDDGIADNAASINGRANGYGVVFKPESLAHIQAVKAYFWSNDYPIPGGEDTSVVIMKADGKMNPTTTMLFDPIPIKVVRGEWNTIDLSHLNLQTEDPFVVTFIQTNVGDYSPGIGIDSQAVEDSVYSYVYAGGKFSPLKAQGLDGSFMIRAIVDYSMDSPQITSVTPTHVADGVHYTNERSVTIEGTVAGKAEVQYYRNDSRAGTINTADGTFRAGILLQEGSNMLKARARVGEKMTDFSSPLKVIQDRINPILTVTEPIVSESKMKVIDVAGSVSDEHLLNVTVNGEEVKVAEDGTFREPVILTEGNNEIKIVAKDLAGNETVKPLMIRYNGAPEAGEIYSVTPQTDQVRYSGEMVTLRVESNITGAKASYAFKLPALQSVETENMEEVTPGIYEATWKVPPQTKLDAVQVEYHLGKDGNTWYASSEGTLEIRPGGVARFNGFSRYDTAARLSKAQFTRSENAVLVSGENFPDALAAGAYASTMNMPLLMTATDTLPEATLNELERLGVQSVQIIGGNLAVGAEVEDMLETQGIAVERIYGNTRYETNATLMQKTYATAKRAFLVSGENFADGLSVVPITLQQETPLLLTQAKNVPNATKQVMTELGVTEVVIVGGKLAISEAVEQELTEMDVTVSRIDGATRYQTNINLYREFGELEATGAILACGERYMDALCGGYYAYRLAQPMILTPSDDVLPGTLEYLKELELREITILGGEMAISPAVEQIVSDLLK